jgi:hypothetical protein
MIIFDLLPSTIAFSVLAVAAVAHAQVGDHGQRHDPASTIHLDGATGIQSSSEPTKKKRATGEWIGSPRANPSPWRPTR